MAVAGSARPRIRPRPRGDARAGRERRLRRAGYRQIAGVDEVGRGCWAGPLVAAAVVLPPWSPSLGQFLAGLRDSKQLSAVQREAFDRAIRSVARAVGLGVVSALSVDLLGLAAAGRLAMERAVQDLGLSPDFLLIDAFSLPGVSCPQEAIIFGDALCLSIAAASVVAKVERDRFLVQLAARYPGYDFEHNKGYGTALHARALRERGVTPEHRYTYAPVRSVLARRPC